MTISPEWKQEMEIGDRYWVGECKTCGGVLLERRDESEVQSTMQFHADEKGHDVNVYSQEIRRIPLICPDCGAGSSFRIYYDEGSGALEFDCRECGGVQEFKDAFDRMVWGELP